MGEPLCGSGWGGALLLMLSRGTENRRRASPQPLPHRGDGVFDPLNDPSVIINNKHGEGAIAGATIYAYPRIMRSPGYRPLAMLVVDDHARIVQGVEDPVASVRERLG